MSPSAQSPSEQLMGIIVDEIKPKEGARKVQEQVDGVEDLDPDNTCSGLNTVLNSINNELEHECLDEVVMQRNAHPIRQSPDVHVPGHKYSIPGLPGMKFLVHQGWAVWFIVRRWVWDSDTPRALVADEMGFGKTFTSVAAAMICKLMAEKVVMGLPLSILWGNTHEEWVDLAQNDFPRIISDKWEWYP